MKFLLVALIAAVTINCLATAVNGKEDVDALAVPYIDMLLPPLEDVQDNSNKDRPAKINAATTKVTSVYKTATKAAILPTKTTTTTTTKNPITDDGNKILSKPSIEVLLPPLLESKIEKEETTSTTAKTTTTTTTTTKRPTTPVTTKRTTTTVRPLHTITTTTLKTILQVPDLLLDPLQPPSFDNDNVLVEGKTKKLPPTTIPQKATTITKTKQKLHKQQATKQLQVKTASSQNENKKSTSKDNHIAESQTFGQQVAFRSSTSQHNNKLPNKTDKVTQQYVAKDKSAPSTFVAKQFHNQFDLYFHPTTLRPPKSGLPTITPFPRRLGR